MTVQNGYIYLHLINTFQFNLISAAFLMTQPTNASIDLPTKHTNML